MHSNEEIERLKREVPIWWVAQQKLKGMRRRGQEYDFLCPYHNDTNPSFQCYKKDDIWMGHCKSCGASKNIFQLIMDADKCSFETAFQQVEKLRHSPEWEAKRRAADAVFSAVGEAPEIITLPIDRFESYERALRNSAEAQAWLRGRGITQETAESFHLGFVQTPMENIISASHPWRDKGWIVFPEVRSGRIVAAKYRSLMGKKVPNGNGWSGFAQRKDMLRSVLYNQDAINPFDDLHIVEGECDNLVLAQAGFSSVSLPSAGWNPSPDVRDALMRANSRFMSGDMDQVGISAMLKLGKELGSDDPKSKTYFLQWPKPYKDANETFLKACGADIAKFRALVIQLMEEAKTRRVPGIQDLKTIIDTLDFIPPGENPNRLEFPWPHVNRWVDILPGEVMFLFGTETKALASDTPIPTPSGDFIPIGELKAGDYVIGSDGQPTRVLDVMNRGVRQAYKITFWDGATIVCDKEHLWSVKDWHRQKRVASKILNTGEIYEWMKVPKEKGRYLSVPLCMPVFFEEKELPLDPYVLGALLGDGCMSRKSGLELISETDEIPNEMLKRLPKGIQMRKTGRFTYGVSQVPRSSRENIVTSALRKLGLQGCDSFKKFIPDVYKKSSISQRLDLLRGMLDTDGMALRHGSIRYSTTSDKLAADLVHLVQSLGGMAKIAEERNSYSHKGRKLIGALSYKVTVVLPKDVCPFLLARKTEKYGSRTRQRHRNIVSVIPTREYKDMTCIRVDAPDGLFAAGRDYILTHNTGKSTWLMNILVHNAIKFGKKVINFSAEISRERYGAMVTAHLLHKNRNTLTIKEYKEAAKMIPAETFYFGYKPGLKFHEVIKLLTDAKQVYGGDIIVVDPLHFIIRDADDINKATAAAMRQLVDFSIQWNVIVIVVGQARKSMNGSRGHMVQGQDARGTAALGEDAATTWIIHRDRVGKKQNVDDEGEPVFSAITKLKLDYSRNSEPMSTRLVFDGSTATFNAYAPATAAAHVNEETLDAEFEEEE